MSSLLCFRACFHHRKQGARLMCTLFMPVALLGSEQILFPYFLFFPGLKKSLDQSKLSCE